MRLRRKGVLVPTTTGGFRSRIHKERATFTPGLVVLAGLSFVVGVAARAPAVAGLGTAVVIALVTDRVTAHRAAKRVVLEVNGPPEATAGDPIEWVITASGVRRPIVLTPAILPREPVVGIDDGQPVLVRLPGLARGRVHHLAIDVVVTGPIGLYRVGRRELVALKAPVPIGPSVIDIDIKWPTPRAVGFGLVSGAPRGDELFRSVRPYVRGDERRRIHWASTAHHGQLMVRECDGTGVIAIQVVVDTGPPGQQAEQTLAAAATVCRSALARGWQVHLATLEAVTVPPVDVVLGSPFGPPLQPAPALIQHPEARVRRVHTERDVNRQLAAAAFGRPVVAGFGGMTCHVTPSGLEWS